MHDLTSLLHSLHRPRLLIRAARIAAEEYRRDPHLARVLGVPTPEHRGAALLQLIEIEGLMDERRKARDGAYSVARHVETLAAVIGEARLMARPEDRLT
ncbi:DUF6477 family protein [Salipiger bermudensis]|uniref:DUF6477 family protein n=1 Tax=Salipiger bermudensis TaxID=344736 RepID=UPI001CD6E796|nr:DUF6477 family protein [Salipiger bermudensis]MCA1284582.1 DUF6477 family protein [Salipiger bermudensis]